MKKRNYRAQKVNEIQWEAVAQRVQDKAMVGAIDVAKVEQYGVLMDRERQVVITVKWEHPTETPELLKRLSALPCGSLTAVRESTGVYGDTLRGQLRQRGVEIQQVSAKRVHEACEVYDGVPSLHDAKAAQVIARLLLAKEPAGGGSSPVSSSGSSTPLGDCSGSTRGSTSTSRTGWRQRSRGTGRRSCHFLELDSVTLEALLLSYGSPDRVAQQPEEARERMRRVSRGRLSGEKIEAVIDSARHTSGLPCMEAERDYPGALAAELRHSQEQKERVAARLAGVTQADAGLKSLGGDYWQHDYCPVGSRAAGPRGLCQQPH